jgi:hypothetical protein
MQSECPLGRTTPQLIPPTWVLSEYVVLCSGAYAD